MWAEPVDSGFVAAGGAAMLYKFPDAAYQMAALWAEGLTAYSRQFSPDVSETLSWLPGSGAIGQTPDSSRAHVPGLGLRLAESLART
jgi:hypothetical protein